VALPIWRLRTPSTSLTSTLVSVSALRCTLRSLSMDRLRFRHRCRLEACIELHEQRIDAADLELHTCTRRQLGQARHLGDVGHAVEAHEVFAPDGGTDFADFFLD